MLQFFIIVDLHLIILQHCIDLDDKNLGAMMVYWFHSQLGVLKLISIKISYPYAELTVMALTMSTR